MNNPLLLLVGKSGSGKSTIANLLELPQLESYTTRPKRYEDETGHTFITDEEFLKLKDIIAYTEYNGYKYCATKEQIDASSIYVIDVLGVKTLLEKYETNRPIIVFYLNTSVRTRIDRMLNRHDHDTAIVSRLYNDEESDWEDELSKLVWNYKNNCGRNVELHVIDANQSMYEVLKRIKDCIKERVIYDECN